MSAAGRISRLLALGTAVIALVASAFYSWSGLGVGVLGFLLIILGVVRNRNRILTVGAFALFLGSVLAGVDGAPPIPVLVSVICTVLVWDLGGYAIDIHHQLGDRAQTERIEVVHAAGSLLVGSVTIAVGYALYMTGTGEQPLSGLLFLLVAAFLLVVALR